MPTLELLSNTVQELKDSGISAISPMQQQKEVSVSLSTGEQLELGNPTPP